jgi:hypothetical protein
MSLERWRNQEKSELYVAVVEWCGENMNRETVDSLEVGFYVAYLYFIDSHTTTIQKLGFLLPNVIETQPQKIVIQRAWRVARYPDTNYQLWSQSCDARYLVLAGVVEAEGVTPVVQAPTSLFTPIDRDKPENHSQFRFEYLLPSALTRWARE